MGETRPMSPMRLLYACVKWQSPDWISAPFDGAQSLTHTIGETLCLRWWHRELTVNRAGSGGERLRNYECARHVAQAVWSALPRETSRGRSSPTDETWWVLSTAVTAATCLNTVGCQSKVYAALAFTQLQCVRFDELLESVASPPGRVIFKVTSDKFQQCLPVFMGMSLYKPWKKYSSYKSISLVHFADSHMSACPNSLPLVRWRSCCISRLSLNLQKTLSIKHIQTLSST